jgi:hypothetical protein
MASEVSICNLALSHLSNQANIASLMEQSVEAQYCSQFYPLARDQVLAEHNWSFATKRANLAYLDNDGVQWQYCYARPNDCLSVIAMLVPGALDDFDQQDYVQEQNTAGVLVMRTNVPDAVLKYTKKITDPTLFEAHFITALSYLLASYLAGPITKDMKLKEAMYQAYSTSLGKARVSNANDSQNNAWGKKHVPTSITGRVDGTEARPDTLTDFNRAW